MRICEGLRAVVMAALLLQAVPARAQLYESVGTRAQGMGGAFVAVADDATAAWWNPAGLASGAYFNLVMERGRIDEPAEPGGRLPAGRTATRGFAMAFPALGLSYYRLQVSQIAPIDTTARPGEARQGVGGPNRLRSLSVSAFGSTVGQSIGDHLVVASTLKLLRGGVAGVNVAGAGEALDAADDLTVLRRTRTDIDLGVMARMGAVRLGATLRNATRPSFGEGADEVTLVRQGRAGLAVMKGPIAGFDGLTAAVDLDLTATPTLFGEVRHAAAGGELWLAGKRLGLRGGVTTNTIGDRRNSASVGVSVAPLKGVFIEGGRTTGADDTLKRWTTTLRLTF